MPFLPRPQSFTLLRQLLFVLSYRIHISNNYANIRLDTILQFLKHTKINFPLNQHHFAVQDSKSGLVQICSNLTRFACSLFGHETTPPPGLRMRPSIVNMFVILIPPSCSGLILLPSGYSIPYLGFSCF